MFKVLHIPTGNFLQRSIWSNKMYLIPTVARFKTRAQAGHAIQDYRLGPKQVGTMWLCTVLFLLPEDYRIFEPIPFIRFTHEFSHLSPIYALSKEQRKLPPKIRERIMKLRNPNLSHAEEFLIMEAI